MKTKLATLPENEPPTSRTRLTARAGSWLGSPVVLAISVVLLVSSVGVVGTGSAYWLLCGAGRERAEAWQRLRSEQLQTSLGSALAVADPLLDQLSFEVGRHPSSQRVEPLLEALYAFSTAHAGLTRVSVSFPDGTFIGVYQDKDGQLRGQVSSADMERQFARDPQGQLQETARRETAYDPRTRDFYRLALEKKRRIWTAPYPFLPTLHTGISRVEPLYAQPGNEDSLLAVLTVDFNASALATLISEPPWPGQRALVVTSHGALLAATTPELRGRARLSPPPIKWADVDDPVTASMRRAGPEYQTKLIRSTGADGETYHLYASRLTSLDDMHITLLSAVSERELYAGAVRQARLGALITGLMTLLGVGFAVALSANIANLRRRREQAELAALHARDEALDLGSYELVALLGAGAMGEVYRARHKLLARDAALKLMKVDKLGDREEEERHQLFVEEARRLASLRCIHTVSVYDFGLANDGRYFLAMELLSGLDLDALVRRYGRQPPARVAAILAQVCDSLAEAHEANLVHRDIKPANVFLCQIAESLDFVKVLDFGLSRLVEPHAHLTRTLEGTPAFMAPEQVLGEPVGHAMDLYAVGGVGFFLLAGTAPYAIAQGETLLAAHVHAPIPGLPEDVQSTTPPELLQLLTRCLAKRPENRPVSARVLAAAFRAVALACQATFTDAQRERWWTRHLAQSDSDASDLPAASDMSTAALRLYTARRSRGQVA